MVIYVWRIMRFYFLIVALLVSFGGTQCLIVDDNARINATDVAQIVQPATVAQLQKIVFAAQCNKQKISIAAKRHSQGGHTLIKDGISIDLMKLNKILALDIQNKTITVQPGVTWAQIQEAINPWGLAVAVMQSSNIFSVGGSVSVNVHGRDPNFGPIIETVRSLKIMLSSGEVVHACRTENADLFFNAIGGYGLFGIIIEIELDLVQNCIYTRSGLSLSLEDYVAHFTQAIRNNNIIGLHFARLNIDPSSDDFLKEVITTTYTKKQIVEPSRDLFTLVEEKNIALNKLLLKGLRKSRLVKKARHGIERLQMCTSEVVCRNNAMRPEVLFLDYDNPHDTDILQEYFVPVDKFTTFCHQVRLVCFNNAINLLNITVRYVPQSGHGLLSYAQQDALALVLFVNIDRSPTGIKAAQQWTQQLIDAALNVGGTYYLPYQLFATQEQLLRAYPDFNAFIERKKAYDPDELFVNNFYGHYVNQNI